MTSSRDSSDLGNTLRWIGGVGAGCAVTVALIVLLGWTAGFPVRSAEGECIGQVVKLSRRGLFWKTWEGTVALTQEGVYYRNLEISVDEDDPGRDRLVADLEKAYTDGRLVRLEYVIRLGSRPWRGGTSCLVARVTRVPARR